MRKKPRWVQWVFSGIGVAAIVFFANIFLEKQAAKTTDTQNNVSNVEAGRDVHITQTINTYRTDNKKVVLPILDIRIPPNNNPSFLSTDEDSLPEVNRQLVEHLDNLNKLDEKFVYIRFHTYVGAGFGLHEVAKSQDIKAGVVYELQNYVDGFGGNLKDYAYGYAVELSEYRNEWGGAMRSILLFPAKGNPFFNAHYMKAMTFEGFAKIRVSGMQGNQFIEVTPAEPIGYYQNAYDEAKDKISEFKNIKWEF